MLVSALVKRGWGKVKMWREISRQRNELRRLSEYLAKDIGISRAEAEREADRPFWDYEPQSRNGVQPQTAPQSQSGTGKQNCCVPL